MNKLFSKIVLISALLLTCIALAQTKNSYEINEHSINNDGDVLFKKNPNIATNK